MDGKTPTNIPRNCKFIAALGGSSGRGCREVNHPSQESISMADKIDSEFRADVAGHRAAGT